MLPPRTTCSLAKRPLASNETPHACQRKFEAPQQNLSSSQHLVGRWSAQEDERLKNCVLTWLKTRGLSTDSYQCSLSKQSRLSARADSKMFKGLWVHVSVYFPGRSVESVKNRGERLFHPFSKRGGWTAENIEELERLVRLHGRKWVQIGAILGRDPGAVRDKFRQLVAKKSGSVKDLSCRWSREEEDRLIEAIKRALPEIHWEDPNSVPLYKIPWKIVAPSLGRTVYACMEKWHSSTHGRLCHYKVKNWGMEDYSKLVSAIVGCQATAIDQVPWESLPVPYSAYISKRMWNKAIQQHQLGALPFVVQVGNLSEKFCKEELPYRQIGTVVRVKAQEDVNGIEEHPVNSTTMMNSDRSEPHISMPSESVDGRGCKRRRVHDNIEENFAV